MEFSLAWNADFLDAQYQLWKSDPSRVSREWQLFFEGFDLAAFPEREAAGVCDKSQMLRQSHVEELIYRYRDLGHLLACLDPLAACPTDHPLLNLSAFKLGEEDLDRTFFTPHIFKAQQTTLREILQVLRETYCRSVGVEYMHLQDPGERHWLQERMEPVRNRPNPGREEKIHILQKLCEATLFEQFLHARYLGQKRFSLEGAEVVVAMMEALVQHATTLDCHELLLGMAHRGRLNIQVNVLQKPYQDIFCEFEDSYDPDFLVGSGDVKYHKGYLSDIKTLQDRTIRMLLATNPSHLEAVDPVVEGIARARQEQTGNGGHAGVMPILIHGDAAFSGQGVVLETLNLSQLAGYGTGGTLHLVIDNQIGFTTLPEDARSTRYTTDVAKMLMVPIFHVHGEDPETAIHVMKLACDYRFAFGKDVVIDVICYRRYGHNEGDEPYYTQPRMYDRIKDRPPLYKVYAQKLVEEGLIEREAIEGMEAGVNECLAKGFEAVHGKTCKAPKAVFYENWEGFHSNYSHEPAETGVPEETLIGIARKLNTFPEGFSINRKLERILKRRLDAVEAGEGIDWAGAEALAFGSLLLEGTPIRLTGQDTRRGTFSQRHSALVDTRTGEHYVPLDALNDTQARFCVYDSLLSENAVLGFEYGYSLVSPQALVLWEAQFGDFANNAQVVIDQFIVSGQPKWQALSGLVLLLPHGLEGQGPEHSSARLERFLQMCAEDNIQVCNPTTPAQYFHLLRRQVKRPFRKPLILITPKSLLRHPLAVSKLSELASGHFEEALDDSVGIQNPRRVLFCSGKVYYELLERREALKATDIAILRLEQFYPFPQDRLKRLLAKYREAQEWFWVQEEPQNMGGWTFVEPLFLNLLGKALSYAGRPAAASPATGYSKVFKNEQSTILDQAVGPIHRSGER